MNIEFWIGIILAGCVFGYVYYQWGLKRDGKRRSVLDAERAGWDWYQVKLRLPYMYTEAGRGMIVVEVKARDKEHAQEEARRLLKGRSMTRCTWVAVNKIEQGNTK